MTRNSEVLKSFVAYCEANPDMRFWQALLNWSGQKFIYFSKIAAYQALDDQKYDGDLMHYFVAEAIDPYNWEGKDK